MDPKGDCTNKYEGEMQTCIQNDTPNHRNNRRRTPKRGKGIPKCRKEEVVKVPCVRSLLIASMMMMTGTEKWIQKETVQIRRGCPEGPKIVQNRTSGCFGRSCERFSVPGTLWGNPKDLVFKPFGTTWLISDPILVPIGFGMGPQIDKFQIKST